MKIVYFPAMNCHLASILNIVSTLTENFRLAYATLWSEFDLNFDRQYEIYISKRIFQNFQLLGMQIENFDCSTPQKVKQIVDSFDTEKFFFVGMDSFFIPWDGAFNGFHENHYFVAQKQKDNLLCFDPVYGKSDLKLGFEQLFSHAFALGVVEKVGQSVLSSASNLTKQQAKEVLKMHSNMQKTLAKQIYLCADEPKKAVKLSKKVSAMVCNRWQFANFFEHEMLALLTQKDKKIAGKKAYADMFSTQKASNFRQSNAVMEHFSVSNFFNQDYFLQWATVKNGLNMLSIKPSQRLVQEIVHNLTCVLLSEQQMTDTLLTLLDA